MKQKWTKAGVQIKHFIIFRTARSFLVPQSKRTNTKTCCITPLSLCVVCLFVWLFAVSLVWMFNGGGSGMLKSHTHLALIGLTKTNAPYKTNIPQRKCFKIILSIEHSNAKALMDRFQQPALFRGFLNTDLTVCSSSRALKRSAWALRSEASFLLVTTPNTTLQIMCVQRKSYSATFTEVQMLEPMLRCGGNSSIDVSKQN